jgi:inosine-uridine nucleoside N-ribohydrolase
MSSIRGSSASWSATLKSAIARAAILCMPVKLLLDTDIGTDVDDAVALAYLLAQPDCELLGITTVTGQARERAALASVLCRAANRPEIPLYPGAEVPLQGEQRQPVAQQAAVLPRWPHQAEFPPGQAVDFLRRTIRERPGEVVLLTIGPLTNAAQLFLSDPEAAGLLKALVIMGGCFNPEAPECQRTEWNVSGDPAASEIVYRAPVRVHRSLGLDVTQKVVMGAEAVRARFTAPLLKPVLDMAEIWFTQSFPAITFHDPLSAAVVFDDTLVGWARGQVAFDSAREPGRTYWQRGGADAPHEVAVSVDPERYFEHFFSVVGQY